MTERRLDELSKEELIRELTKLQAVAQRSAASAADTDSQRLIHDLHVHQIELEMQNRELREAQGHLEESRSRYADLYDFAPVGYCTLDRDGVIQEINLTGARLLGVKRDDLVHRRFSFVAPLKDKRPFLAHLTRCTREQARVTSELVLSLGRRGERTVQIVSDPLDDPDRAVAAYRTVLVDITELKQLEGRLRLLSEAGEALISSLDYKTALEVAARVAVPVLADLCMVDVLGEGGAIERVAVVFADPAKQKALAERMRERSPRPGWKTAQARVIESGEPMLLSEVSDQARAQIAQDDQHAATLRTAEIRSLVVVPLVARGHVLGALTLAAAGSDRRYGTSDLQIAQDLASRAALAVDNARLYARSQTANEALRIAEARSSGILAIAADAIISTDEQQRITVVNDSAERVFGYARAELIGKPIEVLLPERFRAIHRQHIERFMAGDAAARRMGERSKPIFGLRKNGEEFPVAGNLSKLDSGSARILTVSLHDITLEKQDEREQQFLAEIGSVLATTIDYDETLSHVLELAVRELAEFCVLDIVEPSGELRRRQALSRDPAHSGDFSAFSRILFDSKQPLTSRTLATGHAAILDGLSPEQLACFADSEEHQRSLRAIDVRSMMTVPLVARGKLLGAIGLIASSASRAFGPSDLRLGDELARRAAMALENAELYQAATRAIQARDDVLGIVAHDLRNPLNGMQLQAAMLDFPDMSPDALRRVGDSIRRSVSHMNRIVEDLLEVTRMEAGQLSIERVSLSTCDVISDALIAEQPLATSASIELATDAPPDLPAVWADRARLLQIFENLIGNAIKFTERGGRIAIGARSRSGEILFWVADTGSGIPAENHSHLFDRFWQARKTRHTGAGLGLPIAKGIVEAHGGRIWVDSTPGHGTTFFFTIPIAPGAERCQEPAPEAR